MCYWYHTEYSTIFPPPRCSFQIHVGLKYTVCMFLTQGLHIVNIGEDLIWIFLHFSPPSQNPLDGVRSPAPLTFSPNGYYTGSMTPVCCLSGLWWTRAHIGRKVEDRATACLFVHKASSTFSTQLPKCALAHFLSWIHDVHSLRKGWRIVTWPSWEMIWWVSVFVISGPLSVSGTKLNRHYEYLNSYKGK
jgi:hypothetical protein